MSEEQVHQIKIPREIKLGIYTYKISFDSHVHCDEERYANCNHRTQEIKIWTDAPLAIKYESLIHEVIHVAQLSHRIDVSDSDIDRIANIVAELFKKNLNIEFDWSDIQEG